MVELLKRRIEEVLRDWKFVSEQMNEFSEWNSMEDLKRNFGLLKEFVPRVVLATEAARKAWKKTEIDAAYAQALSVGVEAMPSDYPGKIFSIQEPSIGRFAVALQKAEAANQATLPLYTLDDELLPAVPVATAKVGFIACFDAAAALDARYRTLMKSIDTATNAEEVEALEW